MKSIAAIFPIEANAGVDLMSGVSELRLHRAR
jgi:hypothetical protein